jgi:hypothetical protein
LPWLWLVTLSSPKVTAISVGAVNDDYVPPEVAEPEAEVENGLARDEATADDHPVSGIVTNPAAEATVQSAATRPSEVAGGGGSDGLTEVKAGPATEKKSLNPFPEESVFEKRRAEERTKAQAEIEAAAQAAAQAAQQVNAVAPVDAAADGATPLATSVAPPTVEAQPPQPPQQPIQQQPVQQPAQPMAPQPPVEGENLSS